MNIARKLNNLYVFEKENEEFNELIIRLKEEKVRLVPVQVPREITDVDASYINNKWNNNCINEAVIYGKNKNYGFLAFTDNEVNENVINNIIKNREMNAVFSKFIPYSTEGDLYTYEINKGIRVEKNIERLPNKKFSVAKCFKIN